MTSNSIESASGRCKRFSWIFTVVLIFLLCLSITQSMMVQKSSASPGIGYWIIVEGAYFHNKQYAIAYGCLQVYNTLRGLGYAQDRLNYVQAATKTTFEQAIHWAQDRVSVNEPLWIYMFDHGGDDLFSFRGGTFIYYNETDDMLDEHIPSNVNVYVIIAACHSGSAIDDLSAAGRMIIASCRPEEYSYMYTMTPVPNWEAFSKPFWDKIKEYENAKDAFNHACWHIINVQMITDQHPLLDDNSDGLGNTGPLPNGGDGNVAATLHIGSHAYLPPVEPVGGTWIPVDKLGLLAPYIGTASIFVVTVAASICFKRVKQGKKKQ